MTTESGKAEDRINLGLIASIFILFGILGLVTSWIYSGESNEVAYFKQAPDWKKNKTSATATFEVGPLRVDKDNSVYRVKVEADVPAKNWSYIDGSLLDRNGKFLFGFGKDLWHERGSDPDGSSWSQAVTSFEMDFVAPEKGTYSLRFNASQSSLQDTHVSVHVYEKAGSGVPHLLYGIIVLILGVVINEIRNRSFKRTFD